MFRTAELGRKVAKRDFERQEPVLRQELLAIQQELREEGTFPVILVFAGVDGAGKGETVNLLNAWMDPRWLVTRAYGEPSDEERERPEFWRYWRDLPARGRIGMFLSSWYSRPVLERVFREIGESGLEQRLERIVTFENALAADGAVILKFWMHLSKKAQKRRFKSLEKDPLQSWRVTRRDWEHWKLYDRFIEAAERTIRKTSTGVAPWNIVEGEDHHYRSLTVGMAVRDAVRRALEDVRARRSLETPIDPVDGVREEPEDARQSAVTALPRVTVLDGLDMSLSLEKPRYKVELARAQAELNLLHRKALERGISTVLVFEGPDAAGKGGAIRRLTAALDARHVQVIPIAAPTDEERAHHYLWRFWRHLSRAGRFTIFDRSWYGRVLVERVEGFATEEEWRRAYAEINDFEEHLIDHGTVLLKFWLHITKDEQLTRFKAREKTPYKRWKLTEEDWRNREKWDDYGAAVNDMVEQTSTQEAPWVLVEGNDKRFARVKVLTTVCEAMGRALGNDDG